MSNITTIGDHLTALEGRIIDANTAQRIEIENLEAARKDALEVISERHTTRLMVLQDFCNAEMAVAKNNAERDTHNVNTMFDTLIANRRKLIAELDGLRMEPEPMQQAAE